MRKLTMSQTACTLVWGHRGDVTEKAEDVTYSLHLGVGTQRDVNEKAEDVTGSLHLGVGTQRGCQ